MTTPLRTTSTSIRYLPRWIWRLGIAYMTMAVILYVLAFPVRYQQLLSAPDATPLQATFQVFLDYLLVIVATFIGFMLVLRRPDESIALLAGVVTVVGSPSIIGLTFFSASLHPLLLIPNGVILSTIASITVILFMSLPDGYLYRRWLVWSILPLLIYDTTRYIIFFVLAPPEIQPLRPIMLLGPTIFIGASILVMVHRYRHTASTIQKQQFKWFFFGILIAMLIFLLNQIIRMVIIFAGATTLTVPLFTSFLTTFGGIISSLSLVFAISRYGLWNIDLTINRSLVVSVVTIILVILFGAVFVLTQNLLRGILGESQSEIAVAIAALVIGISFNPVRHKVRTFVDRRLYGFRFDLDQLARHKEIADITNPGALTGRTLGGYTLLGVIGRGNMGEVYQA